MVSSRIKYRVLATLTDWIVCMVVIFLIMILTSTSSLVTIIIDGSSMKVDTLSIFKLLQAGIIIETYLIIYSTIIPLYTHGQTLGRFLFKIRIVKQDGSDCDFASLFIRQTVITTLLPIMTFGISIIVSFILVLYRRDRLSIGDILARTKIVDAYVTKEEE